MAVKTAHTVLELTPTTVEFLKRIKYPMPPEGTKYIAFFDDGSAALVEHLRTNKPIVPKMVLVGYYDINLPIEVP